MIKHVKQPVEPPRVRNRNVEITDEAQRVILRALRKRPEQRYETMGDFARDLQNCYGRVRFQRPAKPPPPDGSFQSLRTPIALTSDKVKRRPVPTDGAIPQGLRLTPSGEILLGELPPPDPGPLLLTRRRSGPLDTLGDVLVGGDEVLED
jgi:hypothetical protein